MASADTLPLLLAAIILLAVLVFAWLWPAPAEIRRSGWQDLRLWATALIVAQLGLYWLFS